MERYMITLVHGTYATNAPWTKKGSKLRNYLKRVFKDSIVFSDFPGWSGWNTHSARLEGAKHLCEYLEQVTKKHSNYRHFIVGHSHGGNVALTALKNPELQDKISGVICLNTPFFAVLKRNTGQLVSVLASLLIGFICGMAVIQMMDWMEDANEGWQKLAVHIVGLLFVAALPATYIAIGLLAYRIERMTSEWLSAKREQFTISIALPRNKKVPVLCLWTAGDEVASWFELFDSLSELPYLLVSPIVLIIIYVVVFFDLLSSHSLLPVMPGYEPCYDYFYAEYADRERWTDMQHLMCVMCVYSGSLGYTGIVIISLMCVGILLGLLFRSIPMGLPFVNVGHNALVRVAFTPIPISSDQVEFCDLDS